MKKYIFSVLLSVPFFSMAQSVDRTKSPAPGKAPLIQVASPVKFTLANGLQVFVVKNTKLPKVTATLALGCGVFRWLRGRTFPPGNRRCSAH